MTRKAAPPLASRSSIKDDVMVYIATNAPTNASWARESLSTSREAVPNLNQCIRVGTDRGKGISAVRTTLQWTAGMRK